MQRAIRRLRRGRPTLEIRVHLDPNIHVELTALAAAAGVPVEKMAQQVLVNDMLRRRPSAPRRELTLVSS